MHAQTAWSELRINKYLLVSVVLWLVIYSPPLVRLGEPECPSPVVFFSNMDAGLYNTLKQNGISDATLGTLLEDVLTTCTFISLQKEHFHKLAQKLTVGHLCTNTYGYTCY